MEAVIYCRVSSKRQMSEGHGNDAQEHICRKFAELKNIEIVEVFKEPGISGSKTIRPAMQEMVSFLRKRKQQNLKTIVIVDDLKRFSREIGGYWELKQIIGECDAKLMSPKHEFTETPEGTFIQTILVASGQLEREQNARQVIDKMKARMEKGYWPFAAPLPGLKTVKEPEHGKIMRRKEPDASIITEALQGYASGRFETQADVMRFIDQQGLYKKVRLEQVTRILKRAVFYAGYLEYPKWDVKLTKAKHDALISFDTFQRIDAKLNKREYDRCHDRAEFPLRGYVECECGKKLTAGMSKGRKEKYPYYFCFNKKCTYYGKSIRAYDEKKRSLEGDFEKLLKKIEPTEKMMALSRANLLKRWDERLSNFQNFQKGLNKKYEEAGLQIQLLADRAANTTNEVAVKAYEKRMDELEKERIATHEEIVNYVNEQIDFRTALDKVSEYLSNPVDRWKEGSLEERRKLINMCFTKKLVYDRNDGFRTVDLSLTYAIISGQKTLEKAGSGHGGN